MALGKARKQRPNFPALPSARAMALSKDFFLKRKNFFAECKSMALGKEFSKKRKILCRVPLRWHSTKRPSDLTSVLFAECWRDTRQRLYRVPDMWHSTKKPLPTTLCRVRHSAKPLLHSAKATNNPSGKVSLPSATYRALGKAFAECHVSTRQKKIQRQLWRPLCRVPPQWHRQRVFFKKKIFAKCHTPALGKEIFSF